MDTLKELFKVGNGPSSSHTMGPQKPRQCFGNETKMRKSLLLSFTVPWLSRERTFN